MHGIDEAIHRAKIATTRKLLKAARRVVPEVAPACIEVADGIASFTGVDSPLSFADEIGALGLVTRKDIAEVTAFFKSRGATPRVIVTPISDPSLEAELTAAGYVPGAHRQAALVCTDISREIARDARIEVAKDLAVWASASGRAFYGGDELTPSQNNLALILGTTEGAIPLEGHDGAAIAVTGTLLLDDASAVFLGGATDPAFRCRGWQLALIRDRVARAREGGARLLRAAAGPGSSSERNFHRCGFVTRYVRVMWELPP
jgi:hypothetical protein